MLELEIQEKYVGSISQTQMKLEGRWRIKRIPPACEVCLCHKGYKVIRQYTEFFFKNKSLYILECACCKDRIELEPSEYNEIKKIVRLNYLKEIGKIGESKYIYKINRLM